MRLRRSIPRSLLPVLLLAVAALLHSERAEAFACAWTGATSTNWATASNWSTCNSTTPQSGDTVSIPSGGNQPTLSTSATVSTVTVNASAVLTVGSGGSLTLNAGLTGGGNLVVSSGGSLTFAGGTVDGAGTLTINSGGAASAATTVGLGRALVNAGTVTLTSFGYFSMVAGGSFTNSGTVDIQHNYYAFYGNVGGLPVTNTGSFNRTTGSGTAIIYNVVFTNTSPGTVTVSSGTLDLQNSGSSSNTGAFTASGGTLQFNGTATNTISGAVTGAGPVVFTGSQTTTFTGTYSATNTTISGGTANFNQVSTVTMANLTTTGGTLAGSGNISVTGTLHVTSGTMTGTGTTTLASSGTGTFDSSYLTLSRPFVNAGAITLSSSAYFYILSGGSLVNQSTGTIDIQHNTYAIYGGVASLTVTNTGSITRTSGTGTATIYNLTLINTSPGTVSVSSGMLDWSTAGSGSSSGAFTASGGTLQFSGSGTNTISGAVTGAGTVIFTGSSTTTLTGTYSVTNTTISGGTANFNEASAVTLANLTMTGGTLAGSANISVTGTLHVTNGTMTGTGTTTLASSGTGTLDSSNLTLSRPFANAGAITLSSSAYFYILSGGSLVNQSTGTIEIQHNTYAIYGGVASLTVTNTGSITRTTGSGTATIYNLTFVNTSPGTVTVSAGTLDLSSAGSGSSSGAFTASGGTLQFSGSGTSSISGAVTGTNVIFAGSPTTTLTGTYSVTNTTISGGTVNFNQASTVTMANLTMTSGTLAGSANVSVTGTLHVTSGTMTGIGTTTLTSTGTGTLDSSALTLTRPFVNAGAITISASAYFSLGSGGSLVNQSTGTIEIQHNTYALYGGVAGLTVTNTGSITRTTGSGTAIIYNLTLTNTSPGTISVSSGTLDLSTAGSSTSSGSFSAPGGTLRFSGSGTNTISGAVTGAGTVIFAGSTTTLTGTYSVTNTTISGGTANFNQASTVTMANLTMTSGTLGGSANISVTLTLHVTSGTMTGTGTTTLAGSGTGTFDSSALTLTRPFVNAGATTMSASAYFSLGAGGSFVNQSGATLEIQQDTYAFYGADPALTVSNAGSIGRTTGAGIAYIYNLKFTNTGLVTVQSGTLFVTDYTQTAGSTSLAGGNMTASGNPLRIQGGTFSGTGTLTGNLSATANAVISPGFSPGLITITGNYVQSSPAALNAELNGTAPSAFDRVAASGSASIGGTLNVTVGYTPSAGDTFPILTYASFVGAFNNLNLPVLAGGLSWLPRYGATAFSLRIQALLPDIPMRVDTHAPSTGSPNLNGVLDPGERVLVEPAWKNPTTGSISVTGTASNFTGPAGATYTINKSNDGYGTLSPSQSVNCFTATGSCFELSVTNPFTRPAAHWDTTFDETLSNGDVASYTVHIGGSFTDVSMTHPQYRFIETLFHNQITGGCGTGVYCQLNTVTRAQMAIFLLKSKFGASYVPPAATGTVFLDVPIGGFGAAYIENLAALGVTGGCGSGNYCPNDNATRAQMSVFLLRTLEGVSYTPPACVTPTFGDVPCSSGFSRWVNELALRGITGGCGGGNYCPGDPVTRGQMAVFLTTTFGLRLNGA